MVFKKNSETNLTPCKLPRLTRYFYQFSGKIGIDKKKVRVRVWHLVVDLGKTQELTQLSGIKLHNGVNTQPPVQFLPTLNSLYKHFAQSLSQCTPVNPVKGLLEISKLKVGGGSHFTASRDQREGGGLFWYILKGFIIDLNVEGRMSYYWGWSNLSLLWYLLCWFLEISYVGTERKTTLIIICLHKGMTVFNPVNIIVSLQQMADLNFDFIKIRHRIHHYCLGLEIY